jgi:hypothetical protein
MTVTSTGLDLRMPLGLHARMSPARFSRAFLWLSILAITPLLPAEDVTVPTEVQALVDKMVAALKTNDDAALSACWHTPETLAKARVAEKQREAATSSEPFNAEKEQERELKRQTRDLETTLKRAAQLRTLLPKHFGPLDGLKLDQIELDVDDDAPADQPVFGDVEIHLTTTDATKITLGVDDLVKIEGVWKFSGRLEDEFKVHLPTTE